VTADHVAVDVQEEARLIGRVDPAQPPHNRIEREAPHPGAPGHAIHPRPTHEAQHARRRFVVRALDHRVDQPVV
jgi:hypothetical protein